MIVVLCTPEALSGTSWTCACLRYAIKESGRLKRVVVEEAHCATWWGHARFRKDYDNIGYLIRALKPELEPNAVQVIAVSATVPPRCRQELKFRLGMGEESRTLIGALDRPNITFATCVP